MKSYLLSTLTLSLLALVTGAGAADTEGSPAILASGATLASGIAIQYTDPSVRAQDDFYAHMNGNWLRSTEIPADMPYWDSFTRLGESVQPQLRGIIESLAGEGGKYASQDQQRVGDFYASFMDEARVEQLGLAPLHDELARIAGLRSKQEIPALIAHLQRLGVGAPYALHISQDNKDSTRYVAVFGQSGVGLPDPDYYLKKNDARLAAVRAQYEAHLEKMLALAGIPDAAAGAKAVLALETELAKVQWSTLQLRDPQKAYNKIELSRLGALTPGYDWAPYLKESGLAGKVDHVIVSQPSYLAGFGAVLGKTPLATWKTYFQLRVLNNSAPYLSKALVDADFAFYSGVLAGIAENLPRWKRAVSETDVALGESLGKLYVERYFPSERKARIEQLVHNLLSTYRSSIDQLDWMSPATKQAAQAKLAKIATKIAYPDRWRDYSALTVASDDLLGNVLRSRAFKYDTELNKLGKPIDRNEWTMTPQTVNAYYNPEMNEIVFPAAILQPPFFDVAADDAANYGAIGAVIGHEISHGFDDQGAQYDGDGNLRDWWTKADHTAFAAKTGMLVKQYGAFVPLKGYRLNGKLSLGENIGDNSGLEIAYRAYHLSLHDQPAPVIDGLTGDQRFYMGFAQVWSSKYRDPFLVMILKTDPHPPGEVRTNGTLRNQAGFYQAFGIKPGDKMYLPPSQRVSIW